MTFILSVGSDPDILNRRSAFLAESGYAIVSVADLRKAADKIANEEFDLMVLCSTLAEQDSRQLVNMSRRHRPFMPVILVAEGTAESELRQHVVQAIGEPASARASSNVA